MDKNKVMLGEVDIKECTNCSMRLARITGAFKCGLKQSEMHKGRMCLVDNPKVGMYWVHEYDLRRKK